MIDKTKKEALAPPSGEGVELPSAEDWLSGGTSYAVASPEWKAGWNAARNRLRSLTTPQSAPVDGEFVLVPREPTLAMIDAGFGPISNGQTGERLVHLYRAMIASAPTPPPASQERGVIGEIISSASSPSGMNIVRWTEGFLPKVGMKLFASEHKHDLVHNVETDTVTCHGCDYLSPPSSAAAKEPEQRCPYCAGLIYSDAGCQNCKVGSVWPKPIAAEQDSSAAEESSNGEPAVPASTVRQQDDVCQDTSLEASPKRQVANPVLSTSVRGLTGHHDFPPVPPIRAAEQAKPDDCPFCGQPQHYTDEDCPILSRAHTTVVAEQAQAGESREARMVVVERDDDGKPTVWCDPEIVDLVTALNAAGIRTVASCSGHGEQHGNIALVDGRELLIAPSFEAAREMDGRLAGGVTVDDAARALVDKLHAVHDDEKYKGVWFCAHNHIGPYTGPKYDKELAALVAALGAK